MANSSSTLLIDNPLDHEQPDLLGINDYQEALIECLKTSDMPITIALQGEWGSGKTSLMNNLKYHLCQDQYNKTAPFYCVCINAWQFSLSSTSSIQITIDILKSVIIQIGNIKKANGDLVDKAMDTLKIIKAVFLPITKVVAEETAGLASKTFLNSSEFGKNIEKAVVNSIVEQFKNKDPLIIQFKDNIEKLINQIISSENNEANNLDKKGFIFFIDDLDRIDPVLSVKILELFKNIFNIEKCIFLLAIDYDIIVQGLKPMFGELTSENEAKFNLYFDKLIQLSISMPVQNYNIKIFLRDLLLKSKFFDKSELDDNKLLQEIVHYAQLSIGNNPRLLKRLINSLSVINHIITIKLNHSEQNNDIYINEEKLEYDSSWWSFQKSKTLIFALTCIQIAFPQIYNILSVAPNFIAWDKSLAEDLKISITESTIPPAIQNEWHITSDWEIILYKFCLQENFSFMQTYNIISIFKTIEALVDRDTHAGIRKILFFMQLTDITCRRKSSVVYVKRPQCASITKKIAAMQIASTLISDKISKLSDNDDQHS